MPTQASFEGLLSVPLSIFDDISIKYGYSGDVAVSANTQYIRPLPSLGQLNTPDNPPAFVLKGTMEPNWKSFELSFFVTTPSPEHLVFGNLQCPCRLMRTYTRMRDVGSRGRPNWVPAAAFSVGGWPYDSEEAFDLLRYGRFLPFMYEVLSLYEDLVKPYADVLSGEKRQAA